MDAERFFKTLFHDKPDSEFILIWEKRDNKKVSYWFNETSKAIEHFNQTGQMLAALLSWPLGTFISQLDVTGEDIEVVREIDGGLESLTMSLPAVVTTDLRLNEPRYASLPNIMKARQKPLDVFTTEDLGVDLKPHLKTLRITEPLSRKPGVKVANVDELLDKLYHEVKVI